MNVEGTSTGRAEEEKRNGKNNRRARARENWYCCLSMPLITGWASAETQQDSKAGTQWGRCKGRVSGGLVTAYGATHA